MRISDWSSTCALPIYLDNCANVLRHCIIFGLIELHGALRQFAKHEIAIVHEAAQHRFQRLPAPPDAGPCPGLRPVQPAARIAFAHVHAPALTIIPAPPLAPNPHPLRQLTQSLPALRWDGSWTPIKGAAP